VIAQFQVIGSLVPVAPRMGVLEFLGDESVQILEVAIHSGDLPE
jgi:hypothetical protein